MFSVYLINSLLFICRLGEVESCLRDMQRSRDEVMENIEQVLKCEEQKLVMVCFDTLLATFILSYIPESKSV